MRAAAAADAACTGTPVSWLRLERYHAGEADEAERRAIDEHLARCALCSACLRQIGDDDARDLPPLRARPGAAAPGRLLVFRRLAPLGPLLAAAAALALLWGRWREEPANVGPGLRTKGDEVGFALVPEAGGPVIEGGGFYRDGERFKALVTCPPELHASWDLVAFERGEASFPLEAQPELACGNGVALRGAFRLTGSEPMTICLVWSEAGPVERAALRAKAPNELAHARCQELGPAP
jgi:hypothetical protein